jgi:iron(III) transport system substrate-binding protein
VDIILKALHQREAPLAERIPGLGLGASALAAEGNRNVHAPAGSDGGPSPAPAQDAGAPSSTADKGEPGPPEPAPQRPGVTEPIATATLDGGAQPRPGPTGAPMVAPQIGGDLRWDLEPYGAIIAAQRGELMPLPASAVDVPDLWRDPGGTWVAVGGRARVLLVNKQLRGDKPGPSRLTALTDPLLKGQVALAAPTGGAALAHFAALYTAWGEERMRAWLKALKDNGAQILATDAEVRLAVVQGRATVGLLGSDEAAKAAAIANVAVYYPDQRTIGTFVWPTALSRPRNAAQPEKAALLAEALADKATEQLLVAREPGFIPLRPGIPVPTGVRSASNLRVVSVEPAQIVADIDARRPELEAWSRR